MVAPFHNFCVGDHIRSILLAILANFSELKGNKEDIKNVTSCMDGKIAKRIKYGKWVV